MKNSIIFTLIFCSILMFACTMNNTSSNSTIKQASINIDRLMGSTFKDVEKLLGTPYSSVYYINVDKLKNKNLNNLTMNDLRDSISIESTYQINKNNDDYLHIYFEDGQVKNAISGSYKIANSDELINKDNLSQTDYKVEFFNNEGFLCDKEFTVEYAKKDYIGKPISNFNKVYKINSANFIASNLTGNEKLYFYPIVSCNLHPSKEHVHPNYSSNSDLKNSIVNPMNNNISNVNQTNNNNVGNYSKSALLIYSKNNKIQSMEIVNNDFIYGLINKTFKK